MREHMQSAHPCRSIESLPRVGISDVLMMHAMSLRAKVTATALSIRSTLMPKSDRAPENSRGELEDGPVAALRGATQRRSSQVAIACRVPPAIPSSSYRALPAGRTAQFPECGGVQRCSGKTPADEPVVIAGYLR
jgi:hypothetical protein